MRDPTAERGRAARSGSGPGITRGRPEAGGRLLRRTVGRAERGQVRHDRPSGLRHPPRGSIAGEQQLGTVGMRARKIAQSGTGASRRRPEWRPADGGGRDAARPAASRLVEVLERVQGAPHGVPRGDDRPKARSRRRNNQAGGGVQDRMLVDRVESLLDERACWCPYRRHGLQQPRTSRMVGQVLAGA